MVCIFHEVFEDPLRALLCPGAASLVVCWREYQSALPVSGNLRSFLINRKQENIFVLHCDKWTNKDKKSREFEGEALSFTKQPSVQNANFKDMAFFFFKDLRIHLKE